MNHGVTPARAAEPGRAETLSHLPSELFLRVLLKILPILRERWMERERPLSPALVWAAERYRAVLAVDGSTLDALIRKLGCCKICPKTHWRRT